MNMIRISKLSILLFLIVGNLFISVGSVFSLENYKWKQYLRQLTNDSIYYTFITDSDGKSIFVFVDPHNDIEFENLNKKEVFSELILLFYSPDRDWAANLFLYSITDVENKYSRTQYVSELGIEKWRKKQKKRDIQFWRELYNNKLDKMEYDITLGMYTFCDDLEKM